MLDKDMIQKNKEEFKNLVLTIDRNNANIEGLLETLENSDFFIAPASTKYHGAFEGGLCRHSLDVYLILDNLIHMNNLEYDRTSIIITSLFHDISKMNYYETTYMNKKVYSDNGSKYDAGGKYDWVSEKGYKTIDVKNRFIYGNHEQTSEYMIRRFIPLTLEESISILHHHGGMGFDSTQLDISLIYQKYPLALMLHLADMTCAYLYS